MQGRRVVWRGGGVRGTAAEWESLDGGGTREKKESWRKEGRGEFSLFSVNEINYFYVCGLFSQCYR